MPGQLQALLALAFVLHAILGALMGLSVDEAHYALYAAHPALSYFDHPPLVGWVQWPLVVLNAPDALLRLLPGALWLGTVVLAYRVTRVLEPAFVQAGCWTVMALLLAPLLHVLGIGLLPDTLLMFWGAALMLLTSVMVQSKDAPRPLQLLLMGLLLGLAGLSKYTAIFTALALALCLLRARGPGLLRDPWLWVAALLAIFMVSPVAFWNARNHWISFSYQAKHGTGNVWEWANVLRYALIQCVAYGPLLALGLLGVFQSPRAVRGLALFFAVPLLVLLYLSGGGTGLPHWTAPAWVALAPFTGIALERGWRTRGRWWVVAWSALGLLQGLACLTLAALMLSGGMPFWAGRAASAESPNPPNPFADLHGWDIAGARALELAKRAGLSSVSVQNWTLASRIGWYARPLPVHVLEDRFDQFDLWSGKLEAGGSTLLVDWSQQPYVTPAGDHGFKVCTLLDHVTVHRLGYALADFDFYACTGWSGDPKPALKPAKP